MKIDKNILDIHRQIFATSCVPSAVETILKIEGILDPFSYCLQEIFGDQNPRSGADFADKTFTKKNLKIKFRQLSFGSLKETFDCIDSELNDNRCVIVPLKTSPDSADSQTYHAYVVCDFHEGGEYRAVTRLYGNEKIIEETDTKARFTANYNEMIIKPAAQREGIDILIYERF
jgi:hypothetical protein